MPKISVQEFLLPSEEDKEDSTKKSQSPADTFDSDEALLEAVECGRFEIVKKLAYNYDRLLIKNEQGWSLLHITAYRGHQSIVQWLLERGFSASVTTPTQWTPLHCAAYKGHKLVAKLLLSYQAPLEAADKDGWTALHCAAFKGYKPVLKLLLNQGASPEAKNQDGLTPKELAIQHNKIEVANYIVTEYNLLSTSLKRKLVEQAAEIKALKEEVYQQQQILNRQARILKKLSKEQQNDKLKLKLLEGKIGLRKSKEQDAKRIKKLDEVACDSKQLIEKIDHSAEVMQFVKGRLFQEPVKPIIDNQSNTDEKAEIINLGHYGFQGLAKNQ